mgnify:FL=1
MLKFYSLLSFISALSALSGIVLHAILVAVQPMKTVVITASSAPAKSHGMKFSRRRHDALG